MKATSERDRVSLAHKLFHFTSNRLEFTRREVSEGWSVEPTDGEEVCFISLGSRPPHSVHVSPHSVCFLIMHRRQTFEERGSLLCIIKTQTEWGRPGNRG